jgi:glycosyltransferase involved in cell wall biosynthesis
VLVIDARSDDRTVEFARAAGARVIERDWTDFSDARRYALTQVTTPWTLMIDADEALDDVLHDAILKARDDVNGYVVRRTTYFCGKPIRMWRNEPLLRLFKTHAAELEVKSAAGGGALLHERWNCAPPRAELAGTLLHFSYPDHASYREKFERYTSIEAMSLRPSFWRTVAEWLAIWPRFVRLLLLKGELLDGLRGVSAAYGSARYRYVSARKAWR